jgi:hypothetical protein
MISKPGSRSICRRRAAGVVKVGVKVGAEVGVEDMGGS